MNILPRNGLYARERRYATREPIIIIIIGISLSLRGKVIVECLLKRHTLIPKVTLRTPKIYKGHLALQPYPPNRLELVPENEPTRIEHATLFIE